MTQPTPEAYEVAAFDGAMVQGYGKLLEPAAHLRMMVDTALLRAYVEAVWPLAIAAARDLIAAEILAHADRFAPADGNLAQRRLRRHLLIAERVAAGPISREQVVEAIKELYRDHVAGPRGS